MSGRMQAGTEASRYSVGSGRKDTSSGQMMLVCLASGRDDTSSGRIKQWTDGQWASGRDNTSSGADREFEIFYLFRSAESSENALTSGIPVYSIFTHK
jgi:hypothetical protein